MADGGVLQMLFDADPWNSTISFQPGIPVTLGGTLELMFAADVDVASQVGRTFDVFDWTGVTPTGAFGVASPYMWDLSRLYTAGDVTLLSVPEPTTMLLLMCELCAFGRFARRAVVSRRFRSYRKGRQSHFMRRRTKTLRLGLAVCFCCVLVTS